MEAEAEGEAEAEAVKSIGSGSDKNLLLPQLPLLQATFFFFLGFFSETEPDLKPCWTSTKWKRKRFYWKWKQVDFKTVEAEAG